MGGSRPRKRDGGGSALAYLGVLATGQAPYSQRLAYWAAVIVPGSLFGLLMTARVQSWGRLSERRWAEILLVRLSGSILNTLLVVVIALMLTAINYLSVLRAALLPALPALMVKKIAARLRTARLNAIEAEDHHTTTQAANLCACAWRMHVRC